MKKIFFALATLAMGFASCSEGETFEPSSSEIQLNITVADIGPDEPVTRAASIKDVWAEGDQVYIWYDANTGATPDLVITYDGNEWVGPEDITPPHHSRGYVKCLYDGRVKVASTVSYTYSFAACDFSFDIKGWTCLTEIVVVVTDIPGGTDASGYSLACDKFTPLSGKGYTVGSDAITATTGTKGATATGFASYIYEGAAAFAFATADYSGSAQNFEFTLANANGTRVCSENLTLEPSTKIQSITLAYSEFAAVSSEHEAVQLWKGGPYWATTNIGASTPEEYGYHFAWGYTGGYVHNGSSWVKASDSSSGITFDRTGFPDYITHIYSDMVRAYWGEDWKVPTKTDFDNLLSKCTVEYVTTGTKGVRFTGKGDYSANSIFLPAAGFGDTSTWGDVGNGGFYFSSTTVENYNEYAYALYFYLDQSKSWVANNKKFCGRSVRPVRNGIFFADENFKAYCVENFDANGDGRITLEEAQAVTAIDCSGKNIASLAGIEYFSNLKALNCSDNTFLTTLDVSGNTSLTTLACDNGIHIIAGTAAKPLSSISAQWAYVDDVKAVFFTFNGSVRAMSTDETTTSWGKIKNTNASNTNDGAYNTNLIASESPAAIWCRAKGSMWYLPAAKEWEPIYNNMSSLNSALSLAGGTQLKTSVYYWTSTQKSVSSAIVVSLVNCSLTTPAKSNSNYVRAIRAL